MFGERRGKFVLGQCSIGACLERINGSGLWRREEGPRLEGIGRGRGSPSIGDGWEQSEEEPADQRWRTSGGPTEGRKVDAKRSSFEHREEVGESPKGKLSGPKKNAH